MTKSIQEITLALDMGAAHVGVAVYKPSLGVLPIKTIHYRNRHELLAEVNTIIKEYGVTRIVVGDMGLPELPTDIERFLDQIKKTGKIEVETFSERLTTFSPKFGKRNVRVGEIGGGDDHTKAAAAILSDYLNYLQDVIVSERLE